MDVVDNVGYDILEGKEATLALCEMLQALPTYVPFNEAEVALLEGFVACISISCSSCIYFVDASIVGIAVPTVEQAIDSLEVNYSITLHNDFIMLLANGKIVSKVMGTNLKACVNTILLKYGFSQFCFDNYKSELVM